ncbi:MAG: hypothetical protein R3F11_00365 [Verrucomicrobiales bacterium]
MKQRNTLPTALLAAFAAAALVPLPCPAADPPVSVKALAFSAQDQIYLDFVDAAGDGQAADFGVEAAESPAGPWEGVQGATFQSLGGGNWRAFAPVGAETRKFFRILKRGVPLTAAFAAPLAQAAESDTVGVLVCFSAPFTGTLRYTLDFGDGAGAQAGQIQVGGATTATIPVALGDDAEVGELRAFNLKLSDAGGIYGVGDNASINVVVQDNDAYWGGALSSESPAIDLGARMLIARDAAGLTGCFKTDRSGFLPANTSDPDGDWPLASLALSGTAFSATTQPIIVPAAESLYGADTVMTLALAASGGGVTENRLTGTFTLSSSVPSKPHLQIAPIEGDFTFFRQAPVSAESEAPTAVAP